MKYVSNGHYKVKLQKIVDKFRLRCLTRDVNIDHIYIHQSDINRPALQFAGYFEQFDYNRIQLVGKVEYNYLKTHDEAYIREMTTRIFKAGIPCMIFTRGQVPNDLFIEMGNEYGVPVYSTPDSTSSLLSEMNRFLKTELAPRVTIHGVLVGRAPDVTRYFIELRGIGIINVKTLFGVQSVLDSQNISFMIKLEEWNKDREYDRLGLEEKFEEILGKEVVCHSIPIRPGRNLAIIVETAAANFRQKRMGYNAAQELYDRVSRQMENREPDED